MQFLSFLSLSSFNRFSYPAAVFHYFACDFPSWIALCLSTLDAALAAWLVLCELAYGFLYHLVDRVERLAFTDVTEGLGEIIEALSALLLVLKVLRANMHVAGAGPAALHLCVGVTRLQPLGRWVIEVECSLDDRRELDQLPDVALAVLLVNVLHRLDEAAVVAEKNSTGIADLFMPLFASVGQNYRNVEFSSRQDNVSVLVMFLPDR